MVLVYRQQVAAQHRVLQVLFQCFRCFCVEVVRHVCIVAFQNCRVVYVFVPKKFIPDFDICPDGQCVDGKRLFNLRRYSHIVQNASFVRCRFFVRSVDFDLRNCVFLGRHPRCFISFSHEIFKAVPQNPVRCVEVIEVNECIIHDRIFRCAHADDCCCVYLESISGKHFIYEKWNQLAGIKCG